MKGYKEYKPNPNISVMEHKRENEDWEYTILSYEAAVFTVIISTNWMRHCITTPEVYLRDESDLKMFDEGMDVARKIFRNGGMTWLQTTK